MTQTEIANEIAARLDRMVAGEQKGWDEVARARAENWRLIDRLESENLWRASLLAHHAARAKAALEKGGLDGLRVFADDLRARLIDGAYECRSTSLLARARGEVETQAARELLREIDGLLSFHAAAAQTGGAR